LGKISGRSPLGISERVTSETLSVARSISGCHLVGERPLRDEASRRSLCNDVGAHAARIARLGSVSHTCSRVSVYNAVAIPRRRVIGPLLSRELSSRRV